MLKELVDAVQDGVKTQELIIGGETFTTREVFRVPPIQTPAKLSIATLQGIVDYLETNIDAQDKEKIFVHIGSHKNVSVVKFLDELNRRENYVEAVYDNCTFDFGRQYEQSDFITLLQSRFVETDNRKAVQKLVGGLSEESSLHLIDDGLSQQTTAKTGITTKERVNLPSPLKLQPFRTFNEVEQPESSFILRLHKRDDRIPLISLHEADNDAWKVEAIQNIKKFLKDKVKVPIIA